MSPPLFLMITLERIAPANALLFKTIRLRALQNDPTAFGSTFAKESQLSDEEWVNRSHRWNGDGAIGYLAFDGEKVCGLVACYTDEQDRQRAHVISMWVDPAWRRAGVGTALIEGLQSWATSRKMRELKLMVTSVNDNAIRFYERLGFRMSGKTGPYPNDPAITEYEMLLPLAP
ncbi:MAG TPA: GNAT family N-acetyltransferase [Terracidiphilus sp.]|jgi:ribosomal protein S18 acetylase RimI-like enzyme|nr:GNAT family N-acetyltransferase [Terracidiphilus sp.]